MTRLEDLPLTFDETVSFTVTVNRQFWPIREQLVQLNHDAAAELAYLTIGFGTFTILKDTVTYEFVEIDRVDGPNIPEDAFGITYRWRVVPV